MSNDYEFALPDVNVRQPRPRVRFYIEAIEMPAKSAEEGRPIFQDREMVSIINPGSRDEFVCKVDDKIRAEYATQYEHWKATQRELIEGTPLEQLPFLKRSQIEEMRFLNIMSAEQLANLSDVAMQKLGHGARDLSVKATAYLCQAMDSAAAVKYAAENKQLKSDVEMLQRQLAELGSKLETMMKEKKDG